VPSQTELLFDLGLDDEIIGVTKFCIHPADKVKQKANIGGTKSLNIKLIKELNPDLIIGNKEENERGQIEELMQDMPVWMSDIADLNSATDMIKQVGEMVGRKAKAEKLVQSIQSEFDHMHIQPGGLRVAYMIWRKPYIIAGKGTFIDAMLQKCGLINAFDTERYPEVDAEQLLNINPDVILLSSEPYPFKEKHISEFRALLPDAVIKLVDGELFSWYGSRLLKVPSYFKALIEDIKLIKS
jgi:ABC-type Fe3+-hydroxamate transport system substrate-binding protein